MQPNEFFPLTLYRSRSPSVRNTFHSMILWVNAEPKSTTSFRFYGAIANEAYSVERIICAF